MSALVALKEYSDILGNMLICFHAVLFLNDFLCVYLMCRNKKIDIVVVKVV